MEHVQRHNKTCSLQTFFGSNYLLRRYFCHLMCLKELKPKRNDWLYPCFISLGVQGALLKRHVVLEDSLPFLTPELIKHFNVS